MKLFKILSFVFILSIFSNAQSFIKSIDDFKSPSYILAQAKESGKNIIIEAKSKYCHYCKKMERDVFNDNKIAKIIEKNFIFVTVDVYNDELPFGLERVYRHITPSFFFLNSNAKLIHHYPGSWTKHDFLMILKENLKEDK